MVGSILYNIFSSKEINSLSWEEALLKNDMIYLAFLKTTCIIINILEW